MRDFTHYLPGDRPAIAV